MVNFDWWGVWYHHGLWTWFSWILLFIRGSKMGLQLLLLMKMESYSTHPQINHASWLASAWSVLDSVLSCARDGSTWTCCHWIWLRPRWLTSRSTIKQRKGDITRQLNKVFSQTIVDDCLSCLNHKDCVCGRVSSSICLIQNRLNLWYLSFMLYYIGLFILI